LLISLYNNGNFISLNFIFVLTSSTLVLIFVFGIKPLCSLQLIENQHNNFINLFKKAAKRFFRPDLFMSPLFIIVCNQISKTIDKMLI